MLARVDAEAVRPLRQRVLRPHQAIAELAYPGDDEPRTYHGAVLFGGEAVSVATLSEEGHPERPATGDWRLRGVATDPRLQGRRLGAAVVREALLHARDHDGRRVWCNARIRSVPFYERLGFVVEGPEFTLPEIGPHRLMTLAL